MAKTKAEIKARARKLAKRNYDRNYRFKKMTPLRKRVAIAKDVLQLLDSEKIIATRGTYIDVFNDVTSVVDKVKDPDGLKLKEFIAMPNVKCEVCAIGAVFFAAVSCRGIDGESNAFRSSYSDDDRLMFDPPSRDSMVDEMKDIFTRDDMSYLELFFEDLSHNDYSDDQALRIAMEHIVKTGGMELFPDTIEKD